MSDQLALVCVFAVAIIAALAWALAWWDVARRKAQAEASRADGHASFMELHSDMTRLEQRLMARTMDLEKKADVLSGLLSEQRREAAKAFDGVRVDHADLDQRTKWCEQNIRDLGKTPPKRTAKNHLPSPFGQKT